MQAERKKERKRDREGDRATWMYARTSSPINSIYESEREKHVQRSFESMHTVFQSIWPKIIWCVFFFFVLVLFFVHSLSFAYPFTILLMFSSSVFDCCMESNVLYLNSKILNLNYCTRWECFVCALDGISFYRGKQFLFFLFLFSSCCSFSFVLWWYDNNLRNDITQIKNDRFEL